MNRYYLLALFVGLNVGRLLDLMGIMNGQKAVDYYAEVHQSSWNSWVHTFFMPYTFLGFTLSVPTLFSFKDPLIFQMSILLGFIVHYITIDPIIGLGTFILYYPIIVLGNWIYILLTKNNSFLNCFVLGICISVVALVIQEYIGHYMGGDDPSRAEGVLNAVLYAKYYSVYHIFY